MEEHASFEAQAVLPPRRRRRDALGVLVAAGAIAAIVGAGVLGARTSAVPDPDALAPLASAAVAVAPPSAPAGPQLPSVPGPRSTPANVLAPFLPRYPTSVLGLHVQPAAYIDLDGEPGPREGGDDGSNGLVAISGWYAPEAGTGCPTPRVAEDPALAAMLGVAADADTFCERSGQIFTAPLFGEHAPPIRVRLRPGVPTPYALRSVAIVSPVVLIGRLLPAARSCRAARCVTVLVVDQVAWSGGEGLPSTPSVLPRLLAYWPPQGSPARDRLIAKAIGDTGAVILDTLVDPETLARIDPMAAGILAISTPTVERIWYRRVLGADPAVDPMLWVAVDDATGNVIGSGSVER